MKRDRLFASSKKTPARFRFDHATAEVFDDMLRRSIPFHHELQRMIVEITRAFVQEGTRVYDLGCSTGTTLTGLASTVQKDGVRFVGVDFSGPMLEKAELALRRNNNLSKCVLVQSDLSKPFEISGASVVILNLTLQFIPRKKRLPLLKNIFKGLKPKGCLILIEKTLAGDVALNRKFVDFYHDYKKRQKYSAQEILRKARALKGVLLPNTHAQNLALLKKSGFVRCEEFFRWYVFSGILALKD
jgi:tRNA (cmo5U34)-methyltransferase